MQWIPRSVSEAIVSRAVRSAGERFLQLHPIASSLPEAPDTRTRLLYIHVPFCPTLCPYCSFHKFLFHEPSALRYFTLLQEEMHRVKALGYRFDALYVGGGTTSVLPEALHESIALARSLFDIKEVSCESDATRLHLLDPNLIERLSVGIQSFDDTRLQQLGRFKKFGSAQAQSEEVKTAIGRFRSVNVDMIYNYPDQSAAQLHHDIDSVCELAPQQVTFYPLMYAPGIGKSLEKRWGVLDHTKEADFYRIIAQRMQSSYTQRSSWAWSLEHGDIIDEYVIERSEYVGIGSGAFSFIGDTLYANTFSLPEYAALVSQGRTGTTHAVSFEAHAIRQYRMMVELFGLRPCSGHLWPETQFLRLAGACRDDHLTPWGSYLLSTMMREFYNGMDALRETMRRPLGKEDGVIHSDF